MQVLQIAYGLFVPLNLNLYNALINCNEKIKFKNTIIIFYYIRNIYSYIFQQYYLIVNYITKCSLKTYPYYRFFNATILLAIFINKEIHLRLIIYYSVMYDFPATK